MSIFNSLTAPLAGRGRTPSVGVGWIGVDIGTCAVKLAQLRRVGAGFEFAVRWALPGDAHPPLTREEVERGGLASRLAPLREMRRTFAGRNCAAALPMSLVDFRSFEVPRSTCAEQRQMVAAELAADLRMEPDEITFDCWESANESGPDPALTRMWTMAVPTPLSERLAGDLLSARLECQILDGVPCALARAVALVDESAATDPVVAIDLSHSAPLIVLAAHGRPVFSRTLRGCGLQTFLQPLRADLRLSTGECQQLLARFGLPLPGESASIASQTAQRLIANPLKSLVDEIARTLDYLGHQFRELQPRRIWLFGGGALIKNLPAHLSQRLRIPAAAWQLKAGQDDPGAPLYGIAAGLSLLAWEESTCT